MLHYPFDIYHAPDIVSCQNNYCIILVDDYTGEGRAARACLTLIRDILFMPVVCMAELTTQIADASCWTRRVFQNRSNFRAAPIEPSLSLRLKNVLATRLNDTNVARPAHAIQQSFLYEPTMFPGIFNGTVIRHTIYGEEHKHNELYAPRRPVRV